ncbi:MAG: TetR/AcrR family transcriptional regulator [Desulforegulaceae bacterium]|nr:TetR/AcrR family transcriptional regulator [Desulforegulaceae bacterium]
MTRVSAFNKLREEEREVRRELIIEATLSLLEKKTFDQLGMRDIAAEAGISPASLYRYFPGQTELLTESFIYDLQNHAHKFNEKLSTNQIDSVEKFAIEFVDTLIKNEASFQMMSYMMIKAEISPELLDKFNMIMRNFLSNIEEVFKKSGIEVVSRNLIHGFYASLSGIVMAFRNFPGKDKKTIEIHMKKLARITAFAFIQNEVTKFDEKT